MVVLHLLRKFAPQFGHFLYGCEVIGPPMRLLDSSFENLSRPPQGPRNLFGNQQAEHWQSMKTDHFTRFFTGSAVLTVLFLSEDAAAMTFSVIVPTLDDAPSTNTRLGWRRRQTASRQGEAFTSARKLRC